MPAFMSAITIVDWASAGDGGLDTLATEVDSQNRDGAWRTADVQRCTSVSGYRFPAILDLT